MTAIRSPRGFTLVELLLASAISLTVLAAVLAVAIPAQSAFTVRPEAVDLQQRTRIAVDALAEDLRSAGWVMPLSEEGLGRVFAPVLPYRVGDSAPDPAAGVFYRPGVISIVQLAPQPGTGTLQPVSRTYYLRAAGPDVSQLMRYNGEDGDFPLLDDVAGLAFEFVGEAGVPQAQPPPAGGDRPLATWGPRPPRPADDDPLDEWGAGENCAWTLTDGAAVSRMAPLGDGVTPVTLTADRLTDGPWCPHAADPQRFDLDLLRIRRVAVRLRLQAQAAFRGPAGLLFARPGSAPPARQVPDLEVHVDVAPRSLNRAS